jgi:hypothetical protein
MMTYYDTQHSAQQWNSPQWSANPQLGQGYGQPSGAFGGGGFGGGLAAYGQPYQNFGQPTFGSGGQGFASRQLSPQDVGEVVRQLVPLLPNILAQAQQPQAAIGYGAFGQPQRMLTPQDVNEVVRQILPIVPQIVGTLQGGQNPLQAAAMYGGHGGASNPWGQQTGYGFGQQNPQAQFGSGQMPFGYQSYGQSAWPYALAAYGASGAWGQGQRLSPQDVNEVVRQLIGAIPQVIGNLQAFAQPRTMQ